MYLFYRYIILIEVSAFKIANYQNNTHEFELLDVYFIQEFSYLLLFFCPKFREFSMYGLKKPLRMTKKIMICIGRLYGSIAKLSKCFG
jgi:hypothetical protein